MHQFPWLVPFISVYYFSTQGDAALQSYTMSCTMTSDAVLCRCSALLRIPGRLKKEEKERKKKKVLRSFGDHGP